MYEILNFITATLTVVLLVLTCLLYVAFTIVNLGIKACREGHSGIGEILQRIYNNLQGRVKITPVYLLLHYGMPASALFQIMKYNHYAVPIVALVGYVIAMLYVPILTKKVERVLEET